MKRQAYQMVASPPAVSQSPSPPPWLAGKSHRIASMMILLGPVAVGLACNSWCPFLRLQHHLHALPYLSIKLKSVCCYQALP